ncbi:N-acetylgalactosaminyltransferase 6-like [Anopheles cruzii]|uniref:N-acetylgalactosaminyltransferase 6-like n=1 Tax=Anopheles cruzii TaxID=68878 RepID=UPI0022EC7C57|nr:N-acetylgalactosaminyltransferase 6-like [Anopheles cruzii]
MRVPRLVRNLRRSSHHRKSLFGEAIVKLAFVACCGIITVLLIIHKYENLDNFKRTLYYRYQTAEGEGFFAQPRNLDGVRIDWHNYELMKHEESRTGPGEQGKPYRLTDPKAKALNEEVFKENGYSAVVSDTIALNRSVPDIRHVNCRTKEYLRELPSVSVIVIFYNEHWSTLLRTVFSVLNRSPPELLQEVILVNDHSTKPFLWAPLRHFVETELAPKVRLIDLPARSGLIVARMAGARQARGDVLIVLDSHTEVNTNWLPPLLEPIAEDYRTCVCPLIDVIAYDTFEYRAQDEGKRGVFDWKFYYKRLPLLPGDTDDPTKPFNSPVMAGGLFAISAKFFWELGGYDEGLDIWGGEQYELSFKIWQCGGRLVDAPCSRVGHIYRGFAPFRNPRGVNFVMRNYKRVAEVWMDEYARFLYESNPQFDKTDAGDLTAQRELRDRLQCKPFRWFLEEVAPDLLPRYPVRDPQPFASGQVQSVADRRLCLDSLNHQAKEPIGLYACSANRTHPQNNQFFTLSYHRDIRVRSNDKCLDAAKLNDEVVLFNCHESQGNQMWRYDYESKQIIHGKDHHGRCLEADIAGRKLIVASCDKSKRSQQWDWGYINFVHLQNWDVYGAKFV